MLSAVRVATAAKAARSQVRTIVKLRELTSTIPGKMPIECSADEAVSVIKSNDKVRNRRFTTDRGTGEGWVEVE